MPKTKAQKSEIVEKLAEKVKRARFLVFTSFSQRGKKGLDFAAMKELKRNLKDIESEYVVSKKSLLDLALAKSSVGDAKAKEVDGSVGVVFGYGEDIFGPLRVLAGVSKKNEALVLFSGMRLDGKKMISKEELVEWSSIPSREVLLGQAVRMLIYPLWGLASALSQIKK